MKLQRVLNALDNKVVTLTLFMSEFFLFVDIYQQNIISSLLSVLLISFITGKVLSLIADLALVAYVKRKKGNYSLKETESLFKFWNSWSVGLIVMLVKSLFMLY